MSLIFIDRRKAGKDKSSPNRKKLMNRIRDYVLRADPSSIGGGSVSGKSTATPVSVAREALEEPSFCYTAMYARNLIIPGNPEYVRGDELPLSSDGDGAGAGNGAGAGGGGDGEDEFVVHVAASEFMDLFFEDCELPNLTLERTTEKMDPEWHNAGYATSGTPPQLSVIRTYKHSFARRKAMTSESRARISEIDAELDVLHSEGYKELMGYTGREFESIITTLMEERALLVSKVAATTMFGDSDLRYHRKEQRPKTSIEAAFIMIMDVSGSMDESKKTLARKWFALLYSFIKRRYKSTSLVFIAHTETPVELTESEFFSSQISGGTVVSPAFDMASDIIRDRFSNGATNVYVAHASDGDNWDSDTDNAVASLTKLAQHVQYVAYAEVGKQYSWKMDTTTLWGAIDRCRTQIPSKIGMVKIAESTECYTKFRELFGKK